MVLSGRPALLLVELVVTVLALGLIGVLRADPPRPPTPITATTANAFAHRPGQDPRGERRRPGTTREQPGRCARRQRLTLNERGKEKVRRSNLSCVATKPADEFAEKAHMAEGRSIKSFCARIGVGLKCRMLDIPFREHLFWEAWLELCQTGTRLIVSVP